TCNGGGVCQANPEPDTTNCGDAGTECTNQDKCDGEGACHDNGFKIAETPCGSASDTDCDNPDTCNGGGSCQANYELPDKTCGTAATACLNQDYCNGSGGCQDFGAKPNRTSCDADGSGCSVGDACQTGNCVAGALADCSGMADACNTGVCQSQGATTYQCVKVPANENGTCTDGNACTQTDKCQSGSCIGTNPIACVAQDQCHVVGVCNTATGQCSNPAKPDRTFCDADADGCTVSDKCLAGACVAGVEADCSTLTDVCYTGVCESTGNASYRCVRDPSPLEGEPCNADTTGCTQNDACTTGVCTPGPLADCSALADVCNDAVCLPTGITSYQCAKDPLPKEGFACDADANGCTVGDACQIGACLAGPAADCSTEDDACNSGICESIDAATYRCVKDSSPKETLSCDADGSGCTIGDVCHDGVCLAGPAADCSVEDDACNAGACQSTSETSYVCAKDPSAKEGESCDDLDICTVDDRCAAGVCEPGEPEDCDDGDPCTLDGCDMAGGCGHAALADGTACDPEGTGANVCVAGECRELTDGMTCERPYALVLGTASTVSFSGTVNFQDAAACHETPLDGPELYFALDVPPGSYRITATPDVSLDAAIVLLGSCDSGDCLSVTDDNGPGLAEMAEMEITSDNRDLSTLRFAIEVPEANDSNVVILAEALTPPDGDADEAEVETDGDADSMDADPEEDTADTDGDMDDETTTEDDAAEADGDEELSETPEKDSPETADGDETIDGDRDASDEETADGDIEYAAENESDGEIGIEPADSTDCRTGAAPGWSFGLLLALFLLRKSPSFKKLSR
ncbi:MAG: hypothetical protein C4523_11380, partial [Myxococcales bacterium]